MFETVSVFDAMEVDNTQARVSSRRALALAHNRVERNLGKFLRAAQTEDEFLERLALVQEDFDGYITTASTEVEHDHPEHIAAALKDHYRLAAGKVEFVKTPEEEEKEDEEEGKTSRWKIVSTEGKQGSPLAGRQGGPYQNQPYPNDQYPEPDPLDQEWDIDRPAFFDQSGQIATDPLRNEQGYIGPGIKSPHKDIARDEGYEQIPYRVNPEDPRTQRDHTDDQGLEIAPNLPSVSPPRGAPIRQGSNEHELVTCPECGGDGKQAGVNRCGKCRGNGKVPNFGDSLLDATFGAKTADGNTDLDGPEPKMDKALWTPSNPGEPKIDDGKYWPTKEKDITEPIKATNDSELTEIGEKSTETQKLPTQTGDTPYATGGEDFGPHTDTFNNDGQTDPVTRESISSANETHQNPLSELLLAEFPSDQVVQAAFLKTELS